MDLDELAVYNAAASSWNSSAFRGVFTAVLHSAPLPLSVQSPPPALVGPQYTPYTTLQYRANSPEETVVVNTTRVPRATLTLLTNTAVLTHVSLPYYRTSQKTYLLRLKAVCVQAGSGLGCYKGDATSIYEAVPWTTSLSNFSFSISVVSPLDPMLVAIKYDYFEDLASPSGLELIGAGIGAILFSIICILALHKRISALWVYGSIAVACHVLSLGAGMNRRFFFFFILLFVYCYYFISLNCLNFIGQFASTVRLVIVLFDI